ncbi:MAG: hypothetical protein ACLFR1_14790 [Spirochaetia bacterium]
MNNILPSKPCFIARLVKYLKGNDNSVYAVCTETGTGHFIDPIAADVLHYLEYPMSAVELEEELAADGWERSGLSELPGILQDLQASGLVTDPYSLAVDSEKPDVYRVFSLDFFAVPTKNRPEALERCLKSWAGLFSASSHSPAILISDASDARKTEISDVVKDFAGTASIPVYLITDELKKQMISLLPEHIQETARFALGEEDLPGLQDQRYGANRNFIHLITQGRSTALADDDILPEFIQANSCLHGIGVSSFPDPSLITAVPDYSVFQKTAEKTGGTEYFEALSIAGKKYKELEDIFDELDITDACYKDLVRMGKNKTEVSALCFLHWGDCGMGNASYLLQKRSDLTADIISEEVYEKMMKHRLVLRAPRRTTIGGKLIMGGHCVFSGNAKLPPFSPYGRNDDVLFGTTMDLLHPDQIIGYPNISILHKPFTPKPSTRDKAIQSKFNANELIRLVLLYLSGRNNFEENYQLIGSALVQFAEKSRAESRQVLALLVSQMLLERQKEMHEELDYFHEKPDYWAEDVYAAIQWIQGHLVKQKYWLPVEFTNREDAFFQYCRNYGSLLMYWPELLERVKDLAPDFLAKARL